MEGMFLQSVPVVGSLVAGGLLLATVVGAVLYARLHETPSRLAGGQEVLRKAA